MGTEDEDSHNKRIARLKLERDTQTSLAAAIEGTAEAEKAKLRAAEATYALAVQLQEGQADAFLALERQRKETEAATEAYIDYDKAGKDLAKTMGGLVGLSGKFEKSMVGQAVSILKNEEGMANFKKQLKETFHPLNVGAMLITNVKQATIALAVSTDNSLTAFNKQTGALRLYGKEIRGLNADMYTHNVNVEAATAAYGAMAKNITDLNTMTPTTRREISDTVSILEGLGVAGETTTANIQFMTKALGMSATESTAMQRELFTLAQEIGMPPAEMAEQFKAAGPKMAEFGKEAGKVFKDLAVNARKAGLEVSDLLALTDKFDTFEGAAESVGTLNAILGGPFLNSMDMVMETDPSKRLAMISDALNQSGKSFDSMTYYEKKAIAAAGGFKDVEELAKVMAGEFENAAGGAHKTEAEMKALKEQQEEFNTLAEESAQFLRAFALDMYPVLEGLKGLMSILQGVIRNLNDAWEAVTTLKNGFGWLILALGTASTIYGVYRVKAMAAAAADTISAVKTGILTGAESLNTLGKAAQTGATITQEGATLSLAAVQTGTAIPAARASTKSIMGFVVALGALLVGVGVAAWGIGQLASAFQSMNAEQIAAAKWALIGFGIGVIALIGALAMMQGGPQAALVWGAVGILLAIGAAAMMMGIGISYASEGLVALAGVFGGFLEEFSKHFIVALMLLWWFQSMGAALFFFGAGSLMAVPGLFALGFAMKGMATYMKGMAEVNASMTALNESIVTLSFVDSENLESVATAIGNIVGHINDVKINKAKALAAVVNASDAGPRIVKAAGTTERRVASEETLAAFGQGTAAAKASVPTQPVTIELKIGKRVFDAMVVQAVRVEMANLEKGKGATASPSTK